jgi:menaquinol-cytochrome c reductase iron-sulfur subunit
VNELETTPSPAGTTRRTFYLSFIYGAWGLITAALAIPAAFYLFFPPSNKRGPGWVDVGDVDAIPSGMPTEVSFQRKRVDGWKVVSEKTTAWVVRQGQSNVIAYGPQCTHLGCAYHWEEQSHTFLCPCHNSEFSLDGKVLSGPAPRPLDRYQVMVEAGRIKIGPLEENA